MTLNLFKSGFEIKRIVLLTVVEYLMFTLDEKKKCIVYSPKEKRIPVNFVLIEHNINIICFYVHITS